ncbi:MAG: ABC transporter substrate-binding protein, partial [Ancylobacter novellus]
MMPSRRQTRYLLAASAAVLFAFASPVRADEAAAKKWLDSGEFQPSTLSKEEQLKELEWFIKAAE